MEDIFKSLSENVSEQCYDEIIGIVEEYINEVSQERRIEAAKNVSNDRKQEVADAERSGNRKDIVVAKLRLAHANRIANSKPEDLNIAPSEKIANKTKKEELLTSVEEKRPKATTMLGNPEKKDPKEPKYLLGVPIKYPPIK